MGVCDQIHGSVVIGKNPEIDSNILLLWRAGSLNKLRR